jgi:DNA-binding transcriptional MerR regulator
VELILHLKDHLYNQGFTIAGARKKLREEPARKVADTAPKPSAKAALDDQLALPLSGSIDMKLLKEIRQDILQLKKSLKTVP